LNDVSSWHYFVAQIYSAKDLSDRVTRIRDVLSGSSSDWTKRVDAVKDIAVLVTK